MKRLFILALFAASVHAQGQTYYISQSGGAYSGSGTPSSNYLWNYPDVHGCVGQAGTIAVANVSTIVWGPGTTVVVCGILTFAYNINGITIGASGNAAFPIRVLFDKDAVMQSPKFPGSASLPNATRILGGAIVSTQQYYIIDCGLNGRIHNTDNGPGGHTYNSYSVGIFAAGDYSIVRNCIITDIMMHDLGTNSGANGSANVVAEASNYSVVCNNVLKSAQSGIKPTYTGSTGTAPTVLVDCESTMTFPSAPPTQSVFEIAYNSTDDHVWEFGSFAGPGKPRIYGNRWLVGPYGWTKWGGAWHMNGFYFSMSNRAVSQPQIFWNMLAGDGSTNNTSTFLYLADSGGATANADGQSVAMYGNVIYNTGSCTLSGNTINCRSVQYGPANPQFGCQTTGALTGATIGSPGSGYVYNDVVTVNQTTNLTNNNSAILTVTAVDANGGVCNTGCIGAVTPGAAGNGFNFGVDGGDVLDVVQPACTGTNVPVGCGGGGLGTGGQVRISNVVLTGGQVSPGGVSVRTPGTGYVAANGVPTYCHDGPGDGSGTGNPCGMLSPVNTVRAVNIPSAGTNYQQGDVVNVTGAGGTGGQVSVDAVDSTTGAVLSATLCPPVSPATWCAGRGRGYSDGVVAATLGGHGTGLTITARTPGGVPSTGVATNLPINIISASGFKIGTPISPPAITNGGAAPLSSSGYTTGNALPTVNPQGGFVTSICLANGGSQYNYLAPPTVQIQDPTGTGATAVANVVTSTDISGQASIGGLVTSVVVTNPGHGYSSTPSVIIDPPPSGSGGVTATAAVCSTGLNNNPTPGVAATGSGFTVNITGTGNAPSGCVSGCGGPASSTCRGLFDKGPYNFYNNTFVNGSSLTSAGVAAYLPARTIPFDYRNNLHWYGALNQANQQFVSGQWPLIVWPSTTLEGNDYFGGRNYAGTPDPGLQSWWGFDRTRVYMCGGGLPTAGGCGPGVTNTISGRLQEVCLNGGPKACSTCVPPTTDATYGGPPGIECDSHSIVSEPLLAGRDGCTNGAPGTLGGCTGPTTPFITAASMSDVQDGTPFYETKASPTRAVNAAGGVIGDNLTSLCPTFVGLCVSPPQYIGYLPPPWTMQQRCGNGCIPRPATGSWDAGAYQYMEWHPSRNGRDYVNAAAAGGSSHTGRVYFAAMPQGRRYQ
jgi:hypothetical protein